MKYILYLLLSFFLCAPCAAQDWGKIGKKVVKAAKQVKSKKDASKALSELKDVVEGSGLSISSLIGKNGKKVTLESLPTNLDELKALPGAELTDEYAVAALAVAVLCNYENDTDETFTMLDFLRGPEPFDESEKKFISERLDGKSYVTRSYLKGATPDNNYTPSTPYVIEISENSSSRSEDGYVKLFIQTSGADTPRPITLRQKASTGQWFVWKMSILTDVRHPKEADPWS